MLNESESKKPAQLKGPLRSFVQLVALFAVVYYLVQLFGVEQGTAFVIAIGVVAVVLIIAVITKLIARKNKKML